MNRIFLLAGIMLVLGVSGLSAQAEKAPGDLTDEELEAMLVEEEQLELPFSFGLGIGIGFASLPDDTGLSSDGWQNVSLQPDFGIGPFGVGLGVDINFRLNGGDGDDFEIRPDDWIPDNDRSALDIFLSKIRYVRYGNKGEPVFALLGSIDKGLLGNGFIVGSYRNTLYMPEFRINGLLFDIDGKAFEFPWLGIETMVANFGRWDLLGARIFARPVSGTDVPLIKEMQLGLTFVTDGNPYAFNPDPAIQYNASGTRVNIWGVDFKQPIVAEQLFSLAFFGDMANQNGHFGSQLGMGGKILAIFDYAGAFRFLGDNFIPAYFDQSYDVSREERLSVFTGTTRIPAYNGWFARIGLNVLEDILQFSVSMDGPLGAVTNASPSMMASLDLREGLLGDLSAKAWYKKNNLNTAQDLIDPEYALIGAKVGYRFGPAIVSLLYDVRYDPHSTRTDSSGRIIPWQVSSKLETSISVVGGSK